MKTIMSLALVYAAAAVGGAFMGVPSVWLAANIVSANIFVACWLVLRAIKEPTP